MVNEDEHIIVLEDVTKTYQMGKIKVHALRGADLVVRRGDFTVILGPSGSGKTTLLNLIGGIDKTTTGKISVDGFNLSDPTEKVLTEYRRTKIGFVFQFFNLIPTLTAKENVEFAAELVESPRGSIDVLDLVGLGEKADRFPSELSGGEQQRVSIARALVKNPPILLCDEAIGELDYQTGKKVLAVLRDINQKEQKTVIFVTHNTAIAQMADKIVHLKNGEIHQIEHNDSPLKTEDIEW